MIVFSCIFFAIQVFLVYNYLFETGWDASTLIATARGLALGEDISWITNEYYYRYPNNLFLVFVLENLYRLGLAMGLTSGLCYAMIIVVLCFISNVTNILLFKIINKLTGKTWLGFVGMLIYILLIGLSPWIQIPYSDTFGLIIPIGILSVYYLFPQNKKILQYLLLGALTILAYKIKPQTCIISIAIVLVDVVKVFQKDENKLSNRLKNFIYKYSAFIISVGLTFVMCSFCINSLGIPTNKDTSFGMTHFLMMGLNEGSDGAWEGSDVDLSASVATYEERVNLNLNVVKDRIKEYGFTGMLHHLHQKLLLNYNDGTFAWGAEGNFYSYKLDTSGKPLATALRSFYYTDEEGVNSTYFFSAEQSIWYCVLFLMIFSLKTKKENIEVVSVMKLTIIGLTLFELLFEARARYLFSTAPIYIILAIYGLNNIIQMIQMKKEKKLS